MAGFAVSRTKRRTAQVAALAALASVMAACHTTRVVWSKPGADQAALQSDLTACHEEALAAAASTAKKGDAAANGDIPAASTRPDVHCMLGRGWKLTPLPSS